MKKFRIICKKKNDANASSSIFYLNIYDENYQDALNKEVESLSVLNDVETEEMMT